MATKTTGAELKKFYTDPSFWTEDGNTWHEEEELVVDGVPVSDEGHDILNIPDNAQVTVSGGSVYNDSLWPCEKAPSFETYFKRWRKNQTTKFLSIEVPNNLLEKVIEAIKLAGGKVV